MPPLNSLTLRKARVYTSWLPKRHIIVLPVKKRLNTSLDEGILHKYFASLLNVIIELGLHAISFKNNRKS